jgi:hypothetical protein
MASHISVFCFVFCVNLSPSTKLAKYFAENLNTLDAKKYGPVESMMALVPIIVFVTIDIYDD